MTWTCLQCRRWVTGRQGDSGQEEWVQGKPSRGVLWQASSVQQVLAEKVQTRHQNYYFHSGFVTFLAIPEYKSPASVLLHPCLTPRFSQVLPCCAGTASLGNGKDNGAASSGELTPVSHSLQKRSPLLWR